MGTNKIHLSCLFYFVNVLCALDKNSENKGKNPQNNSIEKKKCPILINLSKSLTKKHLN